MSKSIVATHIVLRSLGVFLLYAGTVLISSLFTFEPSSTPLFWPANAIVLVIMLYSTRKRAWIYLGSACLGYFLYLFYYDIFGFWPSWLLTASNGIEIVAGYILIQRFASKPIQFKRLRNSLELIGYGVILNSVVGATAGTILMSSVWEAPTFINWSIWFGTAAIGYLMVLPVMISWISSVEKDFTRAQITEALLICTFCLVASLLIFFAERDKPLVYPYIAFPVLLLSALRFDMRITSFAFLIFITISSIGSSQGVGPFAMGEFYREIVLVRFHLFCAITTMTIIIVSALKTEREVLVTKLQDALSEIKTLSGFLPICSHCKKIRDDSGYWNQLEEYIRQHSDAEFSHGICPTCMKRYYGDLLTEEELESEEYEDR